MLTEALQHLYSGATSLEGAALHDWLDDRGLVVVQRGDDYEPIGWWSEYLGLHRYDADEAHEHAGDGLCQRVYLNLNEAK